MKSLIVYLTLIAVVSFASASKIVNADARDDVPIAYASAQYKSLLISLETKMNHKIHVSGGLAGDSNGCVLYIEYKNKKRAQSYLSKLLRTKRYFGKIHLTN